MKNQIGITSTGTWTPHQYAIREQTAKQMLTQMGDDLDRATMIKCATLLGWSDPTRDEYDDGEFYSHLCQAVDLHD